MKRCKSNKQQRTPFSLFDCLKCSLEKSICLYKQNEKARSIIENVDFVLKCNLFQIKVVYTYIYI